MDIGLRRKKGGDLWMLLQIAALDSRRLDDRRRRRRSSREIYSKLTQ